METFLDLHPDLTNEVIYGLGWLYLIIFVMNLGWTIRSVCKDGHFNLLGVHVPVAAIWAFYSGLLLMFAATHLMTSSDPNAFLLRLPLWFKDFINSLADPISYFTLSVILFIAVICLRKFLVRPTVGWCLLNGGMLFLAVSLTDWDFRQIVGKPDNVPIVAMLYIVGFFTWLAFSRGVENDNRRAEGRPLLEQEENQQVLVWPDLVYTELICMIAVTALLIFWGIALEAPLEEPGSAVKTPNPSKAPWYFLGLQEMLVYYDPWLAGVVFPSMILGGLMALPYIDFNKLGNGYYTFKERKFAISVFIFGFAPLWVALIILGTFLRGPNWNIFGIYEYWDVHKLEALNNVNLSELFWGKLGMPMPEYVPGDYPWWQVWNTQTGTILMREGAGFAAVLIYLMVLPPMMAATVFKKFYLRMGFIRYMVFSNLALMMAALPIKMILRWTLDLKYIIAIPEWFFNI